MDKILYLFLIVGLFSYGGVVAEEPASEEVISQEVLQATFKDIDTVFEMARENETMSYAEGQRIFKASMAARGMPFFEYIRKIAPRYVERYLDNLAGESAQREMMENYIDFGIRLAQIVKDAEDFDPEHFKTLVDPFFDSAMKVEGIDLNGKITSKLLDNLSWKAYAFGSIFERIIESGSIPLAELGIKYGGSVTHSNKPTDTTLLIRAIRNRDNKMVEFLLRHNANPNQRYEYTWHENQDPLNLYTPLHFAVDRGSAKIVDNLVKAGANIKDGFNVKLLDDEVPLNPLHYAMLQGNVAVAAVLKKHYTKSSIIEINEEQLKLANLLPVIGLKNQLESFKNRMKDAKRVIDMESFLETLHRLKSVIQIMNDGIDSSISELDMEFIRLKNEQVGKATVMRVKDLIGGIEKEVDVLIGFLYTLEKDRTEEKKAEFMEALENFPSKVADEREELKEIFMNVYRNMLEKVEAAI